MRRAICFFLALILIMGAACAETTGATLGFRVLAELCDGTTNQAVSPVSLAYALAMAAAGAEGNTEAELLQALGIDDPAEIEKMNAPLIEAGVKLANAAFVKEALSVEEGYIEALNAHYGAEWFEMSDTVVEDINAWVKQNTDGMIDRILRGELEPDTVLVLLNAISMDAKWQSPFVPEQTEDAIFHAPEGDVDVPFMHQDLYVQYGEVNGAQILRLPYLDSGLSMLIALPKEGDVTKVLGALCEQGLDYFEFEDELRYVDLYMPKVQITVENQLTDTLKSLGIEAAFTPDADFSGVSEDVPLKIGDVLQKVYLSIAEKGTKAAAITLLAADAMGAMPQEKTEVRLDRPYVAVIAEEESGAVCFACVIANPDASA